MGGIMTIVSLMIGSGIFLTVGEMYTQLGASAGITIIVWVITGFLALTGALCYAELGTMIPGSGGEAQYLAHSLGILAVFLFNWTSILIIKPGTVAILSYTCANHIIQMFNPLNGTGTKHHIYDNSWLLTGASIFIVGVVSSLASISTRVSNHIQNVLTYGKVVALGAIIVSGAAYSIFYDKGNVAAENLGRKAFSFRHNFEFAKLTLAVNNGLWAFDGWNNLNIVAGNLKNPSRNLPLAIWIAMSLIMSTYILTILGYFLVLPPADFYNNEVVGMTFGRAVIGSAGKYIMSLLISGSTFSSCLSSMVTSSEIIILASSTGQFPQIFSRINSVTDTATYAYIMQAIIATGMLLCGTSRHLIDAYTIPSFIFYGACVFVLIMARFTHPNLHRPYRVWITTPILFLIACLWLIITSAIANWIPIVISLAIIGLGIPVYYISTSFFGVKMFTNFEKNGSEKIVKLSTSSIDPPPYENSIIKDL